MFTLVSDYAPCGSQPKAIETLTKNLEKSSKPQVLLGITGSGKTFTMANIIKNSGKPALILAHNKTLAAQLYQEFKGFFPDNAVEYFVSYYDYYQPEAYIARSDTYIEKDLQINDQIDRMRLSATRSLIERDDVIIVSSVSCIYGIGSPEFFKSMRLSLHVGMEYERDALLYALVDMQYKRNDYDLARSSFRARGDVIEVALAYEESLGIRIELFGDEIETISEIDPLTGRVIRKCDDITIYPGSHHVTPVEVREKALVAIEQELKDQLEKFDKEGKMIEKHRLHQRTKYDMEMIREIGFCKGIENYSRHFSDREPGDTPVCLLDYFPEDFTIFVDESHQTVPQVRAMFNGDKARKTSLVEFGFRLPSAYDNRPLRFEEFHAHLKKVVYVSATPAPYEIEQAEGEVVEQVIRPTGLLDPLIEVRKATGQIDDCLDEINTVIKEHNGRILVTTLTKRLSEDITKYLTEIGVKAKYLHSDIVTLERMKIIKGLRTGEFDVLVGINLLREGLDIPEVMLVAILDADKEGFLRSETALIQTCGRAARNEKGRVILYGDKITASMQKTLDITKSRRALQEAYNKEHNITPTTVSKKTLESLTETFTGNADEDEKQRKVIYSPQEIKDAITRLDKAMKAAAKEFRFEDAATLRDELTFYKSLQMLD